MGIKQFFLDIPKEELKKHKKEIVDWSYKISQVDNFWKYELQELINFGGKKIKILTREGNMVNGVLTGVHMSYLQLNDSIRIFFDDIDSLILF